MTDERLREVFREMRDEPIPADSMARVRMRVSARIARRRWIWAGVWGLVPVCAVLLVFIVRSSAPIRHEIAREPAILRSVPHVAPEQVVRPAVIRAGPRRVRRRHLEQRAALVSAPPAAIRIETDDPDVVILLVGN